MTDPAACNSTRSETYRSMLRAVPGLDGMYSLVAAMIAERSNAKRRVLIVGAGGGREIEALGKYVRDLDITALDPSEANLAETECAAQKSGTADCITFVRGEVEDLPSGLAFDAVTSLLVMHHLRDDGAKLNYLTAVKHRLGRGCLVFHADVSCESPEEFERLIPAYLAHARYAGVPEDVARIEIEAVSRLPIVAPARTRALFGEAGFNAPREIFRSLWYRCWIGTLLDP